jgi:hypothetical protein
MKLYCVTITGVDNLTDHNEILELSRMYPWLEWGVLLSKGRLDTPRYPGPKWLSQLANLTIAVESDWKEPPIPAFTPRFAAHLCGQTMRDFIDQTRIDNEYRHEWMQPFGLGYGAFTVLFDRAQINFNAEREVFGVGTMKALLEGWYESFDGNIITQHNTANHWVWEAMQREEMGAVRAHQILHDASGGRGKSPESWAKPIAGVLNGYAGGIRPSNVIQTLLELEKIVGDGYIWIDMEGGVRDEQDRLNMPAIHRMLKEIAMVAEDRNWF